MREGPREAPAVRLANMWKESGMKPAQVKRLSDALARGEPMLVSGMICLHRFEGDFF